MVKNPPSSLRNSTSNMSLRGKPDVQSARDELEATKLEMAALKKEMEILSQKQMLALDEQRKADDLELEKRLLMRMEASSKEAVSKRNVKGPAVTSMSSRPWDHSLQPETVPSASNDKKTPQPAVVDTIDSPAFSRPVANVAQYPQGHFAPAYRACTRDEPAKVGFADYASQPNGFATASKDNKDAFSGFGSSMYGPSMGDKANFSSSLFGGFQAAIKSDIHDAMRASGFDNDTLQLHRDIEETRQKPFLSDLTYSMEKLAAARRLEQQLRKTAFATLEDPSQAMKDMSRKLASSRLINPWGSFDGLDVNDSPKIPIGSKPEGPRVLSPESYTKPFCDFLTENPTVFHAVDYFAKKLTNAGFKKLSERKLWNDELEQGGKYFVERNGSSLIAFVVGSEYKGGNGIAMVAGHVDALTARLKPVSTKRTTAGYLQLGVAPYAGALNSTWWDRDLGIGGRVLVKDSKTGKIESKLVKLDYPIARIPTLAPHFGVGMTGQNNAETQAVPIIGLDNSDLFGASEPEWKATILGGEGTFAATQPPKLVKAIAGEMGIQDYSSIVNWELELFDTQPAQVGGLEKEFIFAGRIDDKLCSWSAIEGLLASGDAASGTVNLVGVFDDEEIGSLLRQGARGNFLPSVVERISESFGSTSANLLSQTYANSFLVSADVTHAVNPNFLGSYLEGHAPRLNVGMVVSADSNGHMTTDSVSTALFTRVAEKAGAKLQVFQIRNDSRSGGTVGPMLSSAMGVRAIDAGIPQLSMHSIRATTGSLDPGLGVKMFGGFFEGFESVDAEFE